MAVCCTPTSGLTTVGLTVSVPTGFLKSDAASAAGEFDDARLNTAAAVSMRFDWTKVYCTCCL
jgi:hypothetical protein